MKSHLKTRDRVRARRRRITICDIAESVGCSPATVSRALRDDQRITEAVREKVKAIARRSGYTPNAIARQLAGRGPMVVAVVVPPTAEFSAFGQMHTAALRGVGRVLSGVNVLMLLSVEEKRDYADLFQSGLCSGLIVLMNRIGDPLLVRLQQKRIPAVLIPGDPGLDLPSINFENRKGAEAITRELLAAGHRNLALIGGARDSVFHQERLAGVKAALAGMPAGQISLRVTETNFSESSGYAACARLLAERNGITALICINDLVAIGVQKAVADAGLSIPRDLSVASLAGLPDVHLGPVRLTRVITDLELVGTVAAETVLAMVNRTRNVPARRRLPVRVEAGASIAPPRL